jgi:PRC-barrel domain
MTDIWSYRDTDLSQQRRDLVGFDVVATDGSIGKIDAATYDVGQSYLVVDTGFWIFGKKRTLPAGIVDRVDYNDRKVYVNVTKDQVRNAPDYEVGLERDEVYRKNVGSHYDPHFRG